MRHKLVAVVMAAFFLCINIITVHSGKSNDYAEDDYRRIDVYDIYENIIEKPIAKFEARRERNGVIIDSVESYEGIDLDTPFPVLECYVGDSITFRDLSLDPDGRRIIQWDWQMIGALGNSAYYYNHNPVNTARFELTSPGETTFFLCVKNDFIPPTDYAEPWSANGNQQAVGHNKWYPRGIYWYFTAITVIVHPAIQTGINVRYWDSQNNVIIQETATSLGELQKGSSTETIVHIEDIEGYKFMSWNVVLPDGTVQYDGTSSDVTVGLSDLLPEKILDIECLPYSDTEVRVRYWDTSANRIMYEEPRYGDRVAGEESVVITVDVLDWDDYVFEGWNIELPDGDIQNEGSEKTVDVGLSGYLPQKYLNIKYRPPAGPTPTPEPTPGPGSGGDPYQTPIPTPAPAVECDTGEITWSENDSHRVSSYNASGNLTYKTCNHVFKYKTTLSATATVEPQTFKSGYGFECEVECSVSSAILQSNTGGCSTWGNNRAAESSISNPTRAVVYIPWTCTNSFGAQPQTISMDNHQTLKFQLPENPISSISARKIYTPVALPGTAEAPVSHSFDIYISGGGVGTTEFCKKLTKTITVNGDMYTDDVSGYN